MLWENQDLWIFQRPITLQSCICQFAWVRQVQTFWVREFHSVISCYSSMSLERSVPCFPPDSHHFISGPWRQQEPGSDIEEKWLAAASLSPHSPLLYSHIPFHSLANSDFLSFSILVLIVPLWLVLSRHPFFCTPARAYSHSISHVLTLPPSISCSQIVLHGQFTKSAFHSPFSPQDFYSIFNTRRRNSKGRERREGRLETTRSETQAQVLGPNGPVTQTQSNRQTGLKAPSKSFC